MNTEQMLLKIYNSLVNPDGSSKFGDGTAKTQITDGTNVIGTSTHPLVINQRNLVQSNDNVSIIPLYATPGQVLQNAATSVGNGSAIPIGGYSLARVFIKPTSVTTGTVTFQISDPAGNYSNVNGIRASDFSVAQNTTTAIGTTEEQWLIPIQAGNSLQTPISILTGTGASYTITVNMVG
jgi:hypothetical protein